MLPAWFATMASGAAGAFVAALAGAFLGFRRTRNERALDRRVSWHEEAVQALAQYEERLERLRHHAMHILLIERTKTAHRRRQDPSDASTPSELPKRIKAPAILWKELGEAERRARAALRLADLYTDGRAQLDCSVALNNSVNMVSGQWIDISAEPEIAWLELQSKAFAAANVRRRLQDSLKAVLELEGLLANVLGPKYRQWRALRRIKQLQADLAADAAATQAFLAKSGISTEPAQSTDTSSPVLPNECRT
jgi:hypothetical protein